MKKNLLLTVGAAFLFSVSSAFAQVGNVPMYFNGGYQGNNWNSGGSEGTVATGFYDGSINNVNVGPGQSSPGMICDDFYDNITANEHWTATGYQASAFNSTTINNTLFGSATGWHTVFGISGLQGYAALAYLANAMFTNAVGNSALQSYISQAMWYLTSAAIGQPIGGLNLDSQALSWVAAALAASYNDPLSMYTNLYLYTKPFDPNGPQEMWGEVAVAAPEGGAALMYLLLGGVTCFGAMFYSRRQAGRGGLA